MFTTGTMCVPPQPLRCATPSRAASAPQPKQIPACWRFCIQAIALVYASGLQRAGAFVPQPRYPVVLVPGIAGSVLDGKFDRAQTISYLCTKHADWHVVYFSLPEGLRPPCLCDELHLTYNKANDTYSNQPGVDIRPHDFGGLSGIAALDPSRPALTATYLPLIAALQKLGYKERVTLWGAPYDWRLAADGLQQAGVADDMQSLIEMAVSTAGAPAVIVAHSMGNLVLTAFMRLWGEEWVAKNIRTVVAVSAPFGGSVASLKGAISGDNFHLHFPHNLLHSVQSTSPSGPWLFPSPLLWGADEEVVTTDTNAYSGHEFEAMLRDIGLAELHEMYPSLLALSKSLLETPSVSVPLVCVYGNGVPTDELYYYPVRDLEASTAPEPNTVQSYEGDGTVNLRSLQACSRVGRPGLTKVVEVPGASHLGIIGADQTLQVLQDVLEMDGPAQAIASLMQQGVDDVVQDACLQSSSMLAAWRKQLVRGMVGSQTLFPVEDRCMLS